MQHIVIVGGGTTAGLAAVYLSRSKSLKITLVEPCDSRAIGVGESTVPIIDAFHQKTKIPKLANPISWLDEVDGTGKYTIEFADFRRKGGKWIHPFNYPDGGETAATAKLAMERIPHKYLEEGQQDWVKKYSYLGRVRERGFRDTKEVSVLPAAYHMDALKYGALLKELALESSNVTLVTGTVVSINKQEDEITSLVLEDGSEISGDTYVDATGFRSALGQSGWVSYSEKLLCDSAITTQLPYIDKEVQQKNTTYCHALSSGWVWNVPLQSRIGTGYVYSSKFMSKEAATKEFVEHLQTTYGYKDIETNSLSFKTGRVENPWHGNVLNLGFNQSFIEPLESTAIGLTQESLMEWLPLLEATHLDINIRRERYNTKVNNRCDSIYDYVSHHYILTERTDSEFWRAYRNVDVSDNVMKLLDAYQDVDRLLDNSLLHSTYGSSLFSAESWFHLFMAYGVESNIPKYSGSWVADRRALCNKCESKRIRLGVETCSDCGCVIKWKTLIKQSQCPQGKWGKETNE